MTLAQFIASARANCAAASRGLKRVAGMPNYQAYLEHLRTHHPGCPVPSEQEYFDEYLKGKYGGSFSRCC